jgi:hypothetical protein
MIGYPRLVRSAVLRSLARISCPVSTGDGQECEKQVLCQQGQRRLSVREETTSGRERQGPRACRHVNFPLTPASNRSRQPRIATRCAVQASRFVV